MTMLLNVSELDYRRLRTKTEKDSNVQSHTFPSDPVKGESVIASGRRYFTTATSMDCGVKRFSNRS